MTAQSSEILIHKGKVLQLFTEPLDGLFEKLHPTYVPKIISTACWRGYIGTWSIENNKLFLIKIESVRNEDEESDLSLSDLFPEARDKVFAIWFNGTLRCPLGDMIEYVHGGYGSTFEQDLQIKIKNGFVKNEKIIKNKIATKIEDDSLPFFLRHQAD